MVACLFATYQGQCLLYRFGNHDQFDSSDQNLLKAEWSSDCGDG